MYRAASNPMLTGTAEVIVLRREVAELKRQLEWFKRRLFGRKSERFTPTPDPQQMHLRQLLGEGLPVPEHSPASGQRVPHTRAASRAATWPTTVAAPRSSTKRRCR